LHVNGAKQGMCQVGTSLTASCMQKRWPLSDTRHPELPVENPFCSVPSSSSCRSALTCSMHHTHCSALAARGAPWRQQPDVVHARSHSAAHTCGSSAVLCLEGIPTSCSHSASNRSSAACNMHWPSVARAHRPIPGAGSGEGSGHAAAAAHHLVGVGEGWLLGCIVRQHSEGRLKQQASYICDLGFPLNDGPAGGSGIGL
jgi:hypothetical protein